MPQTIEQRIEEMIPRLTEEVAAKIRDVALSNMTHSVSRAVQAEVEKHISEIIIPAVRADLAEHEAEIKAAVIAAIKGVFSAVGAQMVESATKKLASYDGDKLLGNIMSAIFRGY